jgi:hypothetical protein
MWIYSVVIATLLLFCERWSPVRRHSVSDLGFRWTTRLNAWFHKHPQVACALSLTNTLLMVACCAFWIDYCIQHGSTPKLTSLLLLLSFRVVVGHGTVLPRPEDTVQTMADIPPAPSTSYYLLSGHTVLLYLTGVQVGLAAGPLALLLFLQSLRMVAYRGHYTADIAIGCAMSFLLSNSTLWSDQ